MKNFILTLCFLPLLIKTFSQNWLPVSQNTKSVFINSELPSNLACFSIDSLDNSNVDSIIYYNYQLYGENHDDSTNYSPCGGFGPSCFLIQNEMSWFGREIIQTNNNWIFINQLNDSLKFNFQNYDTSIIFQSQNRILKLIYLNDTVINIWGHSDSLKNYKIIHQSVNGVNFSKRSVNYIPPLILEESNFGERVHGVYQPCDLEFCSTHHSTNQKDLHYGFYM